MMLETHERCSPRSENSPLRILGGIDVLRREFLSVSRVGAGVANGPLSALAHAVHLIITMIKWIRTSRLSIKNSLSLSALSHCSERLASAHAAKSAGVPRS